MAKIKVYVAHAMTGKIKAELVKEAEYTTRQLESYGFEVLDPIGAEEVKATNEVQQQSAEQLAIYWRRDKDMIKEADIVLDYMACNKSDGVAKEIGYARWCLWKPVVRVFPNCGVNISRIEDDAIVNDLPSAIDLMHEKYGSYEKLKAWRQAIWDRSFQKWVAEQNRMNERYGVVVNGRGPTCILEVV